MLIISKTYSLDRFGGIFVEIEFGVLSASINIQNIFMEIKWSRISRNRYLKISTRIDFGIISVLTEIGVLPVEIGIGVLFLSINIQKPISGNKYPRHIRRNRI